MRCSAYSSENGGKRIEEGNRLEQDISHFFKKKREVWSELQKAARIHRCIWVKIRGLWILQTQSLEN